MDTVDMVYQRNNVLQSLITILPDVACVCRLGGDQQRRSAFPNGQNSPRRRDTTSCQHIDTGFDVAIHPSVAVSLELSAHDNVTHRSQVGRGRWNRLTKRPCFTGIVRHSLIATLAAQGNLLFMGVIVVPVELIPRWERRRSQ